MRHNPWDLLVLQHIITFPEDLWFPFLSPNLYLSNKSCLSCGSFFLFYLSSSFSLPELLLHLSCLQHSNHRTWSRSQAPRIIKVKQRYTVIFCSRTNSSIILRISKPCGICICMATRLVEVCNVVAVTFIAASAAAIAHYHHQKKKPDQPFLGTRRIDDGVAKEYVWQSHKKVRARIENVAKGLTKLGLGRQQAIGLYSVNTAEWVSTIYISSAFTMHSSSNSFFTTLGRQSPSMPATAKHSSLLRCTIPSALKPSTTLSTRSRWSLLLPAQINCKTLCA